MSLTLLSEKGSLTVSSTQGSPFINLYAGLNARTKEHMVVRNHVNNEASGDSDRGDASQLLTTLCSLHLQDVGDMVAMNQLSRLSIPSLDAIDPYPIGAIKKKVILTTVRGDSVDAIDRQQ